VGGPFGIYAWFGWLFELWLGFALRPLEMSFRPEALFQVSSWVAFHGCSLKLTNDGHQCWALMAMRLSSTKESDTKVMSTLAGHVASGTEFLANQFVLPSKEPMRVYL
jgi:hypothetical protein